MTEAFLWLGIYLTINLQLSSVDLLVQWWGATWAASEFARPFYWGTWVLTWCLPPIVLARGIRQKNRSIIAVGSIVAILTLVCNKPYLGWQRHTWDPILLGILLTSVAVFLRRWLAGGAGGIRMALPLRVYATVTASGSRDPNVARLAAALTSWLITLPQPPHTFSSFSEPGLPVPAQIAERSGVLGWNFDYFDAVERRNRLELRDKGCDGCDLAILVELRRLSGSSLVTLIAVFFTNSPSTATSWSFMFDITWGRYGAKISGEVRAWFEMPHRRSSLLEVARWYLVTDPATSVRIEAFRASWEAQRSARFECSSASCAAVCIEVAS